MTNTFDAAFERTVGLEGGYTNDPNDRGGETMYGITAAVWSAYCNERGMGVIAVKDMTLAEAKAVYFYMYWTPPRLDNIHDPNIAAEIFDTAVNCGLGSAQLIAQRAVNFTCYKICAPVDIDGHMGPLTRAAINAIAAKYPKAFMVALNGYQFEHYEQVAKVHPTDAAFIKGWLANRVGLGEY